MKSIRERQLQRLLTIWVGALLAGPPAAGGPFVLDAPSEAYRSVISAGGSLEIHKDSRITGSIHGNDAVTLAAGVVVEGDLSAVGTISLRGGTVTGSVSSPVPARAFPAFPTDEQARSLAHRVIEGDYIFPSGTVVDDVIFVSGEARFRGSIDGRGTVIAGKGIRFDNVSRGQPATLEPESLMSFVSLGDIWVGQGRELRGWLLAAGSIEAHMGLELEGVLVAGKSLAVHKDAIIAFRPPRFGPPVVVITRPEEGAFTNDPLLQVGGVVTDSWAVASVEVNGEAAELLGEEFEVEITLEEGFNGILVVATDTFGDQGFASRGVILDTLPPEITITTPVPGQLTNTARVRVAGQTFDSNGVTAVSINGHEVQVADGRFEAEVSLAEGPNQLEVVATDRAGNRSQATREVTRFTLPEVAITSPTDLSFIAATTVAVIGAVGPGVASVAVNGVDAELNGTQFVASDVPLIEGGNTLTAVASDSLGRTATATIHVVRDLTPPRVAIYRPAAGSVVLEPTISVSGLVNDIVPGTVNAAEATVTVNGIVAEVFNRSFYANGVPLMPGENSIVAFAVDASGNSVEDRIVVRYVEATRARVRIVSGNLQTAVIGESVAEPLVVELLDAGGLPVAGRPVLFAVSGNNGSLDGGRRRIAVTTDGAGRAQASFTLGTRAGVANQVVEASAAGFAGPAVFTASALPGAPASIVVDSGSLQMGIAGRQVPRPLIAVVVDEGHNRLEGIPVVFRVVKGRGFFPHGSDEIIVATDSDGRAITSFTLDPEEGVANNVVEALILGEEAGTFASFVSSGLAAGDPADTTISGVVLDNTNVPISGATLRVKHSLLTAVTDHEGQFRIEAAPVGAVKLIVDGSTVARPGAWPDLEFDVVTIAGRDNTVNMPIYLLPLDLEGGLYVDETRGGILTLPAIPGFALEIAPGSVTFPGGGKSGLVSVTVVHNDKVPMVPNFGQQPRMIVTIQPADARFEPPARLTLPNLEGLAPGEVTEMYSFDHDLGHFVSIGPATVSDDATVIVSNPGVGIVKAGWHCGGNPSASGTTHDCPDCQVCVANRCTISASRENTPCKDSEKDPPGKVCIGGKCTCAVPTGFRQNEVVEVSPGRLRFTYSWSSNSGDVRHLEHCSICESVNYPVHPFPPPFPPNSEVANPTIRCVPGNANASGNGASAFGFDDLFIEGQFIPPYFGASVSASQFFFYACPCVVNDLGLSPPITIFGPLAINYRISENPDGSFKFTIGKSGASSSIDPLP